MHTAQLCVSTLYVSLLPSETSDSFVLEKKRWRDALGNSTIIFTSRQKTPFSKNWRKPRNSSSEHFAFRNATTFDRIQDGSTN
jgi:hypothetical protein